MVKVLFEDNHLLVLEKPAGLLTIAGGTQEDNLQDQGKAYLKISKNKPGNVFLEPVHRIDRPVSGIVLLAKTSKALSRLMAAMREGKYEKIYTAKVEGKWDQLEGRLVHYLTHDEYHAQVVGKTHPQGKESRLSYHVVENGDVSLVEIILETGRYHQIRAQMAAVGHPIVGDSRYGSKTPLSRILLHHSRLSFAHPVTHDPVVVESPPNF
jgi:23S rRNA pseudouridine1911/1915/1917 synthase